MKVAKDILGYYPCFVERMFPLQTIKSQHVKINHHHTTLLMWTHINEASTAGEREGNKIHLDKLKLL
jgi:hypothetical protein